MAANGSKIDTWGHRTSTLNFGDKRAYREDFYLADITRPILGANFYNANNVAIDLRGRRLIHLNGCCTLSAELENTDAELLHHGRIATRTFLLEISILKGQAHQLSLQIGV